MHHRLIRGQREPQHPPTRQAVTQWLASASLLSAGVITAAMIAAPAQASSQRAPAAAPRMALPGTSVSVQQPSRYKAHHSLPNPASDRRSGAVPDTSIAGQGNGLGDSTAVSANGKVAAVAAMNRGTGGVVYVYAKRAGSWKRIQTLQPTPPVPEGTFGWSVGLSSTGSTLMVDEPASSGDRTVFIYTRNKSGRWAESATIGGTNAQSSANAWGQSAAISGSGTEVLVGAPFADHYHGAAFLYEKTTGGAWHLATTWHLTKYYYIGWDVALSGTGATALVSNYTQKVDVAAVYQLSASSWKLAHVFTKSTTDMSFGFSVALSANGSTAAVGEPGASNGEGIAYIYADKNNTWSLSGTLSLPSGAAGDSFGWSVALSGSGTAALIGAAPFSTSGPAGAAYIFTSSAGSWSQQADLTPSDGRAGNQFGSAVALSSAGSTAVIGAPSANGGSGEAYVFQAADGSWAQQTTWTQSGEDSSDQFGTSVGISASGNTAVIGALGNNEATGAAYVYTHRHGKWVRSTKLTASDAQPGARFGEAVAISGNGSTIAVGANGSGATTSKLYIFALRPKGWTQTAEVPDPTNEENFAWDLSLSGNGSDLAVGFLGGAYANYYIRQKDGSWKLTQEITGPVSTAFGLDVALSSDDSTLFIGESGNTPGRVLVYKQSDGKWKKSATLEASDSTSDNIFGDAIAASANGSRVAIASAGNNSDQGAMYVFGRDSSGKWKQISELTAGDGAPGDALGFSPFCPCTIGLTANGITAVIGAERTADSAGAAYAFSASSSKSWSQTAEFTGSPNYQDGQVGFSDDISGNGSIIMVGANGAADSSGVVYIYTPGSKGWTLAQTLVDP